MMQATEEENYKIAGRNGVFQNHVNTTLFQNRINTTMYKHTLLIISNDKKTRPHPLGHPCTSCQGRLSTVQRDQCARQIDTIVIH
jgi:hypothetical protein